MIAVKKFFNDRKDVLGMDGNTTLFRYFCHIKYVLSFKLFAKITFQKLFQYEKKDRMAEFNRIFLSLIIISIYQVFD